MMRFLLCAVGAFAVYLYFFSSSKTEVQEIVAKHTEPMRVAIREEVQSKADEMKTKAAEKSADMKVAVSEKMQDMKERAHAKFVDEMSAVSEQWGSRREELLERLDLSYEQKEDLDKVKSVFERERKALLQKMRGRRGRAEESTREELLQLKNKFDKKIESILGEEKFSLLEQERANFNYNLDRTSVRDRVTSFW